MIETPQAQRIAERLIRTACGRLPADVRADRCREWAAELPAILDDQSIRLPILRSLRALTFGAGISRTTRRLSRSARASSRRTARAQWRTGASATRTADVAVRVLVGLLAWAAVAAIVITVVTTHPDPGGWPFLLLVSVGIVFDGFCLTDIARAKQVRYLPKWAWLVICLAQLPGGGIAYLSLGHVGRRPVPPGTATP
jgi:hypothetical protein